MLTAREIELHIRNKGAERGIVHVLSVLAEQQRTTHSYVMQLADIVSKLSDAMVMDAQVRGKMIGDIERLKRGAHDSVEGEGADDPQGLLRGPVQ